jgi:hypothetical protein
MKRILIYSLLLIPFFAKAQGKEKDTNLPKGNDSFVEKNYTDAEADYRISESKNPKKSNCFIQFRKCCLQTKSS